MNPQASPTDTLLTPAEVSDLLGVKEPTLSNWRYMGKGPTHIKLTRKTIRYRQSDIDAWLEEQAS